MTGGLRFFSACLALAALICMDIQPAEASPYLGKRIYFRSASNGSMYLAFGNKPNGWTQNTTFAGAGKKATFIVRKGAFGRGTVGFESTKLKNWYMCHSQNMIRLSPYRKNNPGWARDCSWKMRKSGKGWTFESPAKFKGYFFRRCINIARIDNKAWSLRYRHCKKASFARDRVFLLPKPSGSSSRARVCYKGCVKKYRCAPYRNPKTKKISYPCHRSCRGKCKYKGPR